MENQFRVYRQLSVKRKYEKQRYIKEINKLVILGIIKKDLSEVYSLEMVIRSLQPRNGHTQKRIVIFQK